MKKFLKIVLAVVVLLTVSGCSTVKKSDTSGYKIYCTNSQETKLVEENYKPSSTVQKTTIEDMLVRLKAKPDNPEYKSAVPQEVIITGYSLNEQQITVMFSDAYNKMNNVTEVLMRAAVVKTLIQIDGLKEVLFEIAEEPLLSDSGEPVGIMNGETFIDTKGEGINSYQYESLTLYFASADGKKVSKEMRNVHYSTNTTLERVVLDQIISGPVNPKLLPILPANTKIIGVSVAKDTCTVNFDESINKISADSIVSVEAMIYGVVNSLIDVCGVTKVQIQVAGESDMTLGGKLNLKTPFERNKDIILQVEGIKSESETLGEVTENQTDGTDAQQSTDQVQSNTETEGPETDVKDTNTHEPTIGVDPNLQKETDIGGKESE